MSGHKTTFALFFGNRGFFPASVIAAAREEMGQALKAQGHEVLTLDADTTRHGAVETPREGEVYANFLRENRGKFGGVILCLPNFGDETGAVTAPRSRFWAVRFVQSLKCGMTSLASNSSVSRSFLTMLQINICTPAS